MNNKKKPLNLLLGLLIAIVAVSLLIGQYILSNADKELTQTLLESLYRLG